MESRRDHSCNSLYRRYEYEAVMCIKYIVIFIFSGLFIQFQQTLRGQAFG